MRERVEYQEVKARLGFEMRTKTKTKNYQKIKKKARGGRRSNTEHNYLIMSTILFPYTKLLALTPWQGRCPSGYSGQNLPLCSAESVFCPGKP